MSSDTEALGSCLRLLNEYEVALTEHGTRSELHEQLKRFLAGVLRSEHRGSAACPAPDTVFASTDELAYPLHQRSRSEAWITSRRSSTIWRAPTTALRWGQPPRGRVEHLRVLPDAGRKLDRTADGDGDARRRDRDQGACAEYDTLTAWAASGRPRRSRAEPETRVGGDAPGGPA